MTDINFLGDMTLPRRSMYPTQNKSSRRRSSIALEDIPLADYYVGLTVSVPQLELYTHVAKDITLWIAHSKEIYQQAEEEAARVPPSLFREFLEADDEVKEDLLVGALIREELLD
jgi:hypothetical protein